MYSTSYLHDGASKTWYGVSSQYAAAFETVFSDAFPDTVLKDPQLFIKKAAMVPPSMLLQAGVPVCRAVQEKGQVSERQHSNSRAAPLTTQQPLRLPPFPSHSLS